MSCHDCYRIQDENTRGMNMAYIRVDRSNVLIGACDLHFNMLRRRLGLDVPLDARVCRVIGEQNETV